MMMLHGGRKGNGVRRGLVRASGDGGYALGFLVMRDLCVPSGSPYEVPLPGFIKGAR